MVSTGFAMNNNMEQLKCSVTHEQYTEAAPSADSEEAGGAEEAGVKREWKPGVRVMCQCGAGARQAGRSTEDNGCGDGVQGRDGRTKKQSSILALHPQLEGAWIADGTVRFQLVK
jgi:hypothetical protein